MPTLKELLEKGESFKYGTDYNKVKADKDTLLEFETKGIRPKFTIRQPLLYGTQTLRITRRSTNILDDMKNSRTELEGEKGGLLTDFISKTKETLGDLASTLKIGIPEAKIPTRISTDSEFIKTIKENQFNIPVTLAKIKKDAAGNILGKFLQQNAQGTPRQIGRQAIGGAIGLAKSAIRNKIFGVNGEPNLSPNIKDTISSREVSSLERFYLSGKPYSSENSNIRGEDNDSIGLYKTLYDITGPREFTGGFLKLKSDEQFKNYANPQSEQVEPKFPIFPSFSINSLTQNIPGKRDKTYTKDSFSSNLIIDKDTIGKFNTKSDKVNSYGVWEGDADGNPTEQIVDNKTIDELDFIPLRFYSVAKGKGASFKATLSGITETFSPSWESSNFIGNPYSFYTYQSINRKIDFTFLMYSLNADEHKKIWEKIDFLSSLTYPQNTTNDVYVTPPLLKLTLGNMYKNKLGFIESLSYTIDDNTPWEIGYQFTLENNLIKLTDSGDLKDYKLPSIINVTVSYQIIETSDDVIGKKLYAYGK